MQTVINGLGFSILLPQLCGMPTASVLTFLHSISKSKGAENVDSHMWRASILTWVQSGFLCSSTVYSEIHYIFCINHCWFILLNPEFHKVKKGPDLFLFLIVPLALGTHSTASADWSRGVGLSRGAGYPLCWGQTECELIASLPWAQMEGYCTWEKAHPSWRDFTAICHNIVMWLIHKSMTTKDVNGGP